MRPPTERNAMFTKKSSTNKDGLTKAIDSLLEEMSDLNGDDPEYAKMADQLTKLYALKEVDHRVESTHRVSMDTMAVVGANLAGILMIVGHERANVVTSKALSLLLKLK